MAAAEIRAITNTEESPQITKLRQTATTNLKYQKIKSYITFLQHHHQLQWRRQEIEYGGLK